MDLKKFFLAAVLALTLSACGETQNQQEEAAPGGGPTPSGTPAGPSGQTTPETQEETTMVMEETEAMVGEGEVTVGGFVVESPGVPESSVPEVATSPEAAREYLDQVQPIVDDTVRDISGLVNPEVQVEGDGITLDLNLDSLEEARQSVEEGANQLQQLDPPEGLGQINQQLVESYEQVLPAYQNIADAAQSGDPEQFASATQESLPEIQAFNTEVNAITEDLERAANQAGVN